MINVEFPSLFTTYKMGIRGHLTPYIIKLLFSHDKIMSHNGKTTGRGCVRVWPIEDVVDGVLPPRRCPDVGRWNVATPLSAHRPPSSLTIRVLLLRGGIHPNPGPPCTYPCSVCSRRVTWAGVSYKCTQCQLWVHKSCSGLSRTSEYSPSWICPACTAAHPRASGNPSPSRSSPSHSSLLSPLPLSPPSSLLPPPLLLALGPHRHPPPKTAPHFCNLIAMACSIAQPSSPSTSHRTWFLLLQYRKPSWDPHQGFLPSLDTRSYAVTDRAAAWVGEAWPSSSITLSPTPFSLQIICSQVT